MTETLYVDDAYLRECTTRITAIEDNQVWLAHSVFYPTGGGQPGDSGLLRLADGREIRVLDTRKSEQGPAHSVEDASALAVGDEVCAVLDWDRRHRHMRMHTCLHLLSVVIPAGVTGGSVSVDKGRLDFDLPDTLLDKDEITARLNELINGNYPVDTRWITDEELDANPELVKTLSVQPPRGHGRVRLVKVGEIDLQPCGGTHVANTGEIGAVCVSKVEKKSTHNRRVILRFAEDV